MRFCLLAVVCICVAENASGAPAQIKWTEQVRLHDGRVVQLERRVGWMAGEVQRWGRNMYFEFCYAPMSVYWRSHSKYPPELFDIVDGRAYAKVSAHDCEVCKLHGYPETDALYFVWLGGSWKQIGHSEFPPQLRLNLLMNPKGSGNRESVRGLVSLAEKEKREPSLHYSLRMTGARGLNELPATRGICGNCKAVNVMTTEIPEVFLPSSRTRCD